MKSINKILIVAFVLLSAISVNAQITNAQKESVKISGNCGMCKNNIEKAGNIKNVSEVQWNKETGIATLTYDPAKTTSDEILKRIALAGYDNEKHTATDDVYSNLHGCCQYERTANENAN